MPVSGERLTAYHRGYALAVAGAGVNIHYPYEDNPEDRAWLLAVAARHHGKLSQLLLQSLPPQQWAAFETTRDAEAFVEELQKTGRWRAWIMA